VSKKTKITIAVALIVLSIPFCKRWFSTVEYYFSDEGEKATSSLKYSLKATSSVAVTGIEKSCKSETIIIPEKTIYCGYLCTVTSIGSEAFKGCSGLTSIEIPASVRGVIGSEAFSGCIGLTNLEIHTSVTENEFGRIIRICNGAFKNCDNLNIVIDNTKNNVKVGKDAFEGCKSMTWKKDM
jgi:hypothetical protein